MTGLLLCRFAQSAAAVVLGGTVVLRLLAWDIDSGCERSWNRLAMGSWVTLVVSGLLQLWLTAAEMSGVPLRDALDTRILGVVLQGTSFGAVWQVRECLLVALVLWWFRVKPSVRAQASFSAHAAGVVLAAGVLVSLVWSGHAHASDHSTWLLPMNGIHVIAAGAWPGGLLPLACLLVKAGREPQLLNSAVTIIRRFSNLSVMAVAVIAFSGLLDGCGLVGAFSALWLSVYGGLLLCKVALFAGMVCLGAVNRRMLNIRLSENARKTIQLLWRNVIWECVLAVAVLLATEGLAMTAPPAGMR